MEETGLVAGVDDEIPKKTKSDVIQSGEIEMFAKSDLALEIGPKILDKPEALSASGLQSAEVVHTALSTLQELVVTTQGENEVQAKSDFDDSPTVDVDIPTSQLSSLPRLVIAKVGAHLSLEDKWAMRLISRHWQNEMEAERIYVMRPIVTNTSWTTFLQSNCPIDRVFFKKLSKKKTPYPKGIAYFRQVKLGPNICVEFLKVFTENCTEFLESLAISHSTTLANVTATISKIPGGIQLNNLTSLSLFIAILRGSTEWESALQFFQYVRISKLTQLEFHVSHKSGQSVPGSPVSKVHEKFFELIETHLEHICVLKYSLESHEHSPFKSLKIPASLLAALPTSKIREIALTTTSGSVYREFHDLILKVDSPLNKVKIHLSWSARFSLTNTATSLESLLQKHGGTLEEIDVALVGAGLSLDIGFLKLCPNLKMLSVNADLTCWGCRISSPSLKQIRIRSENGKLYPFTLWGITDLTVLEYLDISASHLPPNVGNLYPNLTEFRTMFTCNGYRTVGDINNFLHSMKTTMPQLKIAKFLGLTLEINALKILLSMPHLRIVYVIGFGEGIVEFCEAWIEPRIGLSKVQPKTAAKLGLEDKTYRKDSCKNKIVFWR